MVCVFALVISVTTQSSVRPCQAQRSLTHTLSHQSHTHTHTQSRVQPRQAPQTLNKCLCDHM